MADSNTARAVSSPGSDPTAVVQRQRSRQCRRLSRYPGGERWRGGWASLCFRSARLTLAVSHWRPVVATGGAPGGATISPERVVRSPDKFHFAASEWDLRPKATRSVKPWPPGFIPSYNPLQEVRASPGEVMHNVTMLDLTPSARGESPAQPDVS